MAQKKLKNFKQHVQSLDYRGVIILTFDSSPSTKHGYNELSRIKLLNCLSNKNHLNYYNENKLRHRYMRLSGKEVT